MDSVEHHPWHVSRILLMEDKDGFLVDHKLSVLDFECSLTFVIGRIVQEHADQPHGQGQHKGHNSNTVHCQCWKESWLPGVQSETHKLW